MTKQTSSRSVCDRVARRLADRVGPRKYSMWFDRTARFDYDGENSLQVAVANRFVADWISKHFQIDIQDAVNAEIGPDVGFKIEVQPQLFDTSPLEDPTPSGAFKPAAAAAPGQPAVKPSHARKDHAEAAYSPRLKPLSHRGHNLRHKLEEFVVGPSNELAFIAAQKIVDDDRGMSAPLFIHGGCGLGKTHLLQGICAKMLQSRRDAKVLYCTGEQFTNDFLAAVRAMRLEEFRKKIRSLDLLAIDDVHFIANKEKTRQEFLHSFEAIELGGAKIILASDSHPKAIEKFTDALVSRCVRGLVVEIKSPDTATRARIVRALAHRRGIPLLETVVEVLASKCRGPIREIEGSLTQLQALAMLSQQKASQDNVAGIIREPIGHTILNQLFEAQQSTSPRRAVIYNDIAQTVMRKLGVSELQLHGTGRQGATVLARALIVHLTREMTTMSYPEIAAAMKRTNHSSVITPCKRIAQQIERNEPIKLSGEPDPIALKDLVEDLRHEIRTHNGKNEPKN